MDPLPDLPAIEYAERSDPGRDPAKRVNEDVCVHRETRLGHLCIVCDGMGGHAAGREAAELSVAALLETFEHPPEGAAAPQVLRVAIEEANRRVYAMRTSEVGSGRPGCTVVAVLMHSHGTEVAHVGDSRAYLVHEGQIFRVTRDHSIVQELVDRGHITPAQAVNHPDANRITRAIGIAPGVEADILGAPVHHVAGDAFVLCSDGLSDLVHDHEILAIVGNEPAAQAVGKMVDLANARGGHDNITVVVVRARVSALSPPPTVSPTIAQTAVSVPPPPSPPTIVDAASVRPTEVAGAPLPASRPLEPTPIPRSPSIMGTPARTASFVALALAGVAAVLLGAVVIHELGERSGRRNVGTGMPIAVGAVDAALDGPTPLSPEHVVLPLANPPPGEPIAPLEPGPSSGRPQKRVPLDGR